MTNLEQGQKEQQADKAEALDQKLDSLGTVGTIGAVFAAAAGLTAVCAAVGVVPLSAGIAYFTEPDVGLGGALLVGLGTSVAMGVGATFGSVTSKIVNSAFNKVAGRTGSVTHAQKVGASLVTLAGMLGGGAYGAATGYTAVRDFVADKGVDTAAASAPVAAYNGPLSFDARANTLSL